MSSPNRTKVLIGSGVLAIVLIAAIAYWPPTFRSEEASGAIGAVKKHHAPQITQKDVILGDEQTRSEQNVLYRDFLTDAAKLQGISASLAAAASRETAASISKNVEEFASELQSRYASRMTAALNAIQLQAKQANNTALQSEAEQMASRLSSSQVSLAAMQQFNKQFANLAAMQSKAAHRISLQDADRELERAFSAMDSKNEVAAQALQIVQLDLNSQTLLSRMSNADEAQYFSKIVMESKALRNVEDQLASQKTASKLSDEAMELVNAAADLESAALRNVQANMSAQIETASALAAMDARLAAKAQSRQSGAMFSRELSNIREAFASRDSEFRARAASVIQAELASMQEYAASRMQYAKLASGERLQASALASTQLQSRQVYSQLANTTELRSRLSEFELNLSNAALASRLSNGAQFAAQCAKLQSQLSSRQQ